jgi:hypothetical protein
MVSEPGFVTNKRIIFLIELCRFCLREEKLMYFRTKDDVDPQQEYDLSKITELKLHQDHSNSFSFQYEGMKIVLQASSLQVVSSWVAELANALQNLCPAAASVQALRTIEESRPSSPNNNNKRQSFSPIYTQDSLRIYHHTSDENIDPNSRFNSSAIRSSLW